MVNLPAQFQNLEQYADWIRPTHQEHARKRGESTMKELNEFYDAIDPHVEAILAYMDQYSLSELPEDAKNVWYLVCAYIEVAQAVERWGAPKQPNAIDNVRIRRVVNHNSEPLII